MPSSHRSCHGAHPIEGERCCMRKLLMHVGKSTSFNDLKIVNGHIVSSFKEAAQLLGLLQMDTATVETLLEASVCKMPVSRRQLFAVILVYTTLVNTKSL